MHLTNKHTAENENTLGGIFNRAKKFGGAGASISRAAFKIEGHFCAVIPKKESYTSETKSYIIAKSGNILPGLYTLMGTTVPISKKCVVISKGRS